MDKLTQNIILGAARREASLLSHHYLGVGHLFLALLTLSPPTDTLEWQGMTESYLRHAIQRRMGRGSTRRLWKGHPYSPRAQVVIGIAHELATEAGRDMHGVDIWQAIVEEGESLAMRTVQALGLNLHDYSPPDTRPDVTGEALPSAEVEALLVRLFPRVQTVCVESGGADELLVLADGTRYNVTIDHAETIIRTALRHPYENHPRVIYGNHGALAVEISDYAHTIKRYATLSPPALKTAADTDDIARHISATMAQGYKATYPLWRHSDWHLPPLLILSGETETDDADVRPYSLIDDYTPLGACNIDDAVQLDLAIVYAETPHIGRLCLSAQGLVHPRPVGRIHYTPPESAYHYIGEPLTDITARVTDTRHEQIRRAVFALQPDFLTEREVIPLNEGDLIDLPNPLHHYAPLLGQHFTGHMAMICPLNLRLSQLTYIEHINHQPDVYAIAHLMLDTQRQLIAPQMGGEHWDDARYIVRYLMRWYRGEPLAPGKPALIEALDTVTSLLPSPRRSSGTMAQNRPLMAFVAIIALGDSLNGEYTLGARRLAYLTAALAMHFTALP